MIRAVGGSALIVDEAGLRLVDVRVDTEHGSSVVDGGASLDACFTPRGACVGLREAKLIEGPTNLVSITPHPRGVLGVDDEDRAHVIAIDGEAGDDEVSS